jgi:uncharacterized membrane protein YcaP (DUF421 family)
LWLLLKLLLMARFLNWSGRSSVMDPLPFDRVAGVVVVAAAVAAAVVDSVELLPEMNADPDASSFADVVATGS